MFKTDKEKLAYLLGTLDYLRTKKTKITNPKYFDLCKELGARKIEGGFDLKPLLTFDRPKDFKRDFDFPEKFKEKLIFYKKDAEAIGRSAEKAISYFEKIKKQINSGTLKGTQLADLLYSIWAVYNLNFDLNFGRVALVKEKAIGNSILKKARLEKVILAMIDYIEDGKEPNIFFFNYEISKYLSKVKKDKSEQKLW